MKLKAFDKLDVLVHPFFAMENARVKGNVGSLKNVDGKDFFEIYDVLGVLKRWKKRIRILKKDPNAVMILVSPHEMEKSNPRQFFFSIERGFSKEGFKQFSKEYQEFLRFAKKQLGNRLFFIDHTTKMQEKKLVDLMMARKLVSS